jgi:hypothetical protein
MGEYKTDRNHLFTQINKLIVNRLNEHSNKIAEMLKNHEQKYDVSITNINNRLTLIEERQIQFASSEGQSDLTELGFANFKKPIILGKWAEIKNNSAILSSTCIICMKFGANAKAYGCPHISTCLNCMLSLSNCPICNRVIRVVVQFPPKEVGLKMGVSMKIF